MGDTLKTAVENRSSRPKTGLLHTLLSVPISMKIMGIGAVVAAIFGTATLYQVQRSLTRSYYLRLEETLNSSSMMMSGLVSRPIAVGDIIQLRKTLRFFRASVPDVFCVDIFDPKGDVVSRSINPKIGLDRLPPFTSSLDERPQALFLPSGELLLIKITPILQGAGGYLRIIVSDRRIRSELRRLTLNFLFTLLLCLVAGEGLALLLTHQIVHPIDRLKTAAESLREGKVEKAEVFAADEIGTLAETFNAMTETLEKRRDEILRKERDRVRLIDALVSAQEEERRRIASELHDEVGAALSALLLMIESLPSESPEIRERRTEFRKHLERSIENVRRLSFSLRPAVLDDFGLESALKRYITLLNQHSKTKFNFRFIQSASSKRPPEAVETTLYRITQEAVNNVLRHAEASSAEIMILIRKDECVLVVEDDGKGFSARKTNEVSSGIGLIGIRERAEILGGTVSVDSEVGRGTTLQVKIPLGREPEI